MNSIEDYGSLVGDGVSNDSTAFKTAHDAAVVAGERELYCDKNYYIPDAYNLGNILFRGPGNLVGAYRKRSIPMSARSPWVSGNDLLPSAHMKNFLSKSNPVVAIIGDSTGTEGGGQISQSESMWSLIQRAIRRAYPDKVISFLNFSIGGSAITTYQKTGTWLQSNGMTLPTWFYDANSIWADIVEAADIDLAFINFGTNNPVGTSVSNIKAVVDRLKQHATVPDILFCTPLPRSTQADVGAYMHIAQEQRDNAAGALRSFAEVDDMGLIDYHRMACMVRDGFDPCAHDLKIQGVSGSMALPVYLEETSGDFNLKFTVDNTGGAAFGSNQSMDIRISPINDNVLRFGKSGPYFRMQGFSGGSKEWLGNSSTGIVIPEDLLYIEVSARNSQLAFYCQNQLAYYGPCHRYGGRFKPRITYSVGTGVSSINLMEYASSEAVTVQASLLDKEIFGEAPFAEGGNGINHPASMGIGAIYARVLEQTCFS